MFGAKMKLFTLAGFTVYIDWSWLIIAVLLTWSLGGVLFPTWYKELDPLSYWLMGVVGAAGLFTSIVLHELSHSLVARTYGVQIRGITLFIFGGVAEMAGEPPHPKAEFLIAIAGPCASVAIALACLGAAWLGQGGGWPVQLTGVLWYLGGVNAVLVAFNLIPAFPLDGGRVLRSILWHIRGNMQWATKVTSTIGDGFGMLLMLIGIVSFVRGQFVGGMWQFLIDMFLRSAAQSSYQQLLMRQVLRGETVATFMQPDVKTVPTSMTLEQLVQDHIYKHHHKMHPVTDHGTLLGCVTTRHVKQVPRDQWSRRTVGEVYQPCSRENTIDVNADATAALARMSQNEASRLMVVDGRTLRGVVALKDLLSFIALKFELEADDIARR